MSLPDVLRKRERDLRLLRREAGVALDASGETILQKIASPGREYELGFSDSEIELLKQIGNVTFTLGLRYTTIEE